MADRIEAEGYGFLEEVNTRSSRSSPQEASPGKKLPVCIIGAGPAGLTAAYLLSKQRVPTTVIEADPEYVGGISRTVHYKGFSFDIGGHRFFSKSQAVEDLWTELLPDDMLDRPRSSRILYNRKLFAYPLKPFEALQKLGVMESALCMLSYACARLFPNPDPRNFEDWVSNHFGRRLFGIFFKTYTEKVWGMNCREISADWAAQRIRGLSLGKAIASALFPTRKSKGGADRAKIVKTLIGSFRYPRRGPGMMWEAAAKKTQRMGGNILMGQTVTGLAWDAEKAQWEIAFVDAQGTNKSISACQVISSAPLRTLVHSISPPLSHATLEAADALRYRDFLTVAIILKDRDAFRDNWIYIHDPDVQVGRIQNYRSWSPEMVPDSSLCCYGMEYFCFKGDELWERGDADLLALAQSELVKLGMAKSEDFVDGCVVRQPKAYPVYDEEYATHVQTIRCELEKRFPTLHVIGRNGMHKYNNQDHAMMTAMLTVQNIAAGSRVHDVWQVNEDAQYHEEDRTASTTQETGGSPIGGLRAVPALIKPRSA